MKPADIAADTAQQTEALTPQDHPTLTEPAIAADLAELADIVGIELPASSGFEHLLLLVGTNPLPPYVVACYFLEARASYPELKQVWLLYSEAGPHQLSTHEPAKRLQQALSSRFGIEVNLAAIREIGSAPAIQQDVAGLVSRLQSQKVHLNYSGGTKAMSLHTYRVIESFLGPKASFSYLDGRRFRIVSDSTGLPLHEQELRSLVRIGFTELIALQGFEQYAPYQEDLLPEFLPALDVFDGLLSEDRLAEYWGLNESGMGWGRLRGPLMQATSGVHQIDRGKYLRLFGRQLRKRWFEHRGNWLSLEPDPALAAVFAALPQAGLLAQDIAPQSDEDLVALYRLVRFLDGLWLEMHSFRALAEALLNQDLRAELVMNLELRQPHWQTYFELDVAALIGYQLLGVSCTSYDLKAACKNKGFEIIHRVRQLGGDEVREVLKMMLVTCANETDCERLQQELSVATGSGKANILVCGRHDLPLAKFVPKIADFLSYRD